MPDAALGLRERNKREKRARITAAARALFRDKGFEATTARQICERAGVGTGTLFLYVRDKHELLFLAFEADTRRNFVEGTAAAARVRGLVEQLMCVFGRFIAYYARDPALSRLIARELFFREHGGHEIGRLSQEFAAHVAELVSAAQARGEIRSDLSAPRIAAALFAHYTYTILGWLGVGVVPAASVESSLRAALELQVEGLRARSTTAPARRRR